MIIHKFNSYLAGPFANGTVKTVIYETNEPKVIRPKSHGIQHEGKALGNATGQHQRNDLTKIKTDHFLINVTKDEKNRSVSTVKEVKSSLDFIKMGNPLIREQPIYNHEIAKGNVPESVEETVKAALISEILDKLKESSPDNLEIKNLITNNTPLHNMEGVSRRREVTDMFVKFLEDLSKRLRLDVVTVAEQLISRSSEKSDDFGVTAGYARDVIPRIPLQFKPIINFISRIVHNELQSARIIA